VSSHVTAALLEESTKRLQADWNQTRSTWTDAKATEFHKTYLEPLPALVAQAGIAMEELNALLSKIRHDCE
jgi:hypothetical protein